MCEKSEQICEGQGLTVEQAAERLKAWAVAALPGSNQFSIRDNVSRLIDLMKFVTPDEYRAVYLATVGYEPERVSA